MIKNEEFVIDLHYYKKHRKNIFDKAEIDKWIMGSNKANTNNYELLANRILKNVA